MTNDSKQIEGLHHKLVASLERDGLGASTLTRELLRPRLTRLAEQGNILEMPVAEQEALVERVLNRVVGLGPLEPLLADPSITEIMVNGLQSVFIERAGKLESRPNTFTSENEILQVINRIVGAAGRRIDESSPLVDARLPDGSRVNAIISPLSRVGPVITIRRFPAVAMTLTDLAKAGTVSAPMENFLRALILARQNLIISGATGSGKTSTLNALGGTVPRGERLVTIEDTAEIRLDHPHLVQLEARQPNIEGKGEVSIRTLLKNALRMRPDRIIVGEARGAEALDMLQAMNTGHPGSLTTIHANSPEEALMRLETMSLMADVELPLTAIRQQIQSAIHYIIQQERLPGGSRKIVAICEMGGKSESGYKLLPLFSYDKIKHCFGAFGRLPERLELFEQAGVDVDLKWFT